MAGQFRAPTRQVPKAAANITDDLEGLLEFYDYPETERASPDQCASEVRRGQFRAAGVDRVADAPAPEPDAYRPALEDGQLLVAVYARDTPFGLIGWRYSTANPDVERAAEGLRWRVGLSAWPQLRRVEAELVAQVREQLNTGQFDEAFSACSALTQQQAVGIVRDPLDTGTQTP